MARHKEAQKDINIEDIREIEIEGPFKMGDQLTMMSNDELSDPPIT
jgi:hypothetical protein